MSQFDQMTVRPTASRWERLVSIRRAHNQDLVPKIKPLLPERAGPTSHGFLGNNETGGAVKDTKAHRSRAEGVVVCGSGQQK